MEGRRVLRGGCCKREVGFGLRLSGYGIQRGGCLAFSYEQPLGLSFTAEPVDHPKVVVASARRGRAKKRERADQKSLPELCRPCIITQVAQWCTTHVHL